MKRWDVRRSRDLEGWLRGLSGYWRARGGGRKGRPDDSTLARLQGYLRPEADSPEREEAPRLLHQVEDARRRVARFTDDQMRMADVAEAVVVVDLPPPERGDGNGSAHYVAMSRARSVLSLIYRDAPSHSTRRPATDGAPS